MDNIVIRDAALGDAERLAEIYRYYVEKTAVSFEYDAPNAEEFRARMRKKMAKYPYLVAVEDGEVCGYAYAGTFIDRAAYDLSCELTIYLDKDCRGRGIGSALYGELEKRLEQMGMTNLYACIGTADGEDEYLTDASPRFHERRGFRCVGTFKGCGRKFGRPYNMIWMEKIIGEN